MLVTGAFLAIFIGLVHSYLGERYILTLVATGLQREF